MYKTLLRPLLYLLPAEAAHALGMLALQALRMLPFLRRWMRERLCVRDDALVTEVFGQRLRNPLGLAAGFDKDATVFEALDALGFGFIEVGTLTALPQPGNPKPRLFRLPRDRALVNRMGFNNEGAAAAVDRLRSPRTACVGVNLGKSKATPLESAADDYASSVRAVGAHAEYVVVNVSSPNTPGLRDLQTVDALRPLLLRVRAELDAVSPDRRVPLLVKVAPDLANEDLDAVADLAIAIGLDGIVATNTTLSRDGLSSSPQAIEQCGQGGLSGAPLKARSLEVLRRLRVRVGDRLVLVSVGGVESADDVWERLAAGATLVQLYTAFVYEGPFVAWRICRELSRRLRVHGATHIRDLRSARSA